MAQTMNKLEQVRIKLVKDFPLLSDKPINNPNDAKELLCDLIGESDREMFCVVNLNAKSKPINFQVVSIGTLNETFAHPREIFKSSILSNAQSIILAHNHPSGDYMPSQQDIALTKKLIMAGEILKIKVDDHIIIGYDEENKTVASLSMADNEIVDFRPRYYLKERECEQDYVR